MIPTRRSFLAAASLLALASRGAGASAASVKAAGFDRRAFDTLLNRPARHREVFAVSRIDGGYPFWDILSALNGYQFGFKEGPGTLHAVAVLYNAAVVLGLDDAAWSKYPFGAYARSVGERWSMLTKEKNPFFHAHSSLNPNDDPDDLHGFYRDYSLQALTKRGVSFLVDDDALLRMVLTMQAANHTSTPEQTLAECRSHLIPGAMLVPSAASALNAAQEAHFTYYEGS